MGQGQKERPVPVRAVDCCQLSARLQAQPVSKHTLLQGSHRAGNLTWLERQAEKEQALPGPQAHGLSCP